jgi:hypothetical protein
MNPKEMLGQLKNFVKMVEINSLIDVRKDVVVYRVFKNEDDKIGEFVNYNRYLDPTAGNIMVQAREKFFNDNYKIQLIIIDKETNKQKGIFSLKG